MVKKFAILLAMIIAVNAGAQEEEPSYDAKSLKNRLKNGAQEKATAADRMKSARGDKASLKILQETDLNYKLPNGQFVLGMMLPNGTVSPAIKTTIGTRPACVTKQNSLVVGVWDKNSSSIMCNIPASELAYIDDTIKFESSGSENKTVISNKYSAKNNNENSTDDIAATDIEENHNSPTKLNNSEKKPAEARHNSNATNATAAPRNYESATNTGYVPAPRNTTALNAKGGTVGSKAHEYGIPRGTWIRAELKRHTTSSDSSNIEFVITESLNGKYKTLEAGTVVFASKSFNTSSKRLEALTSAAVTPDGEEISGIVAYVYASDQSAGLSGTIIRDREGEAIAAGKSGVLAAVADALPGAAGVATGVVSNLSGEMITHEKNNIKGAPTAYIQVAPQTVWLKTTQKI